MLGGRSESSGSIVRLDQKGMAIRPDLKRGRLNAGLFYLGQIPELLPALTFKTLK